MKGPFRDNCLRYNYLLLAFLMAGWVEGIRRALVLGLVLIVGTAIEQTPSVGPLVNYVIFIIITLSLRATGTSRGFPCILSGGCNAACNAACNV